MATEETTTTTTTTVFKNALNREIDRIHEQFRVGIQGMKNQQFKVNMDGVNTRSHAFQLFLKQFEELNQFSLHPVQSKYSCSNEWEFVSLHPTKDLNDIKNGVFKKLQTGAISYIGGSVMLFIHFLVLFLYQLYFHGIESILPLSGCFTGMVLISLLLIDLCTNVESVKTWDLWKDRYCLSSPPEKEDK